MCSPFQNPFTACNNWSASRPCPLPSVKKSNSARSSARCFSLSCWKYAAHYWYACEISLRGERIIISKEAEEYPSFREAGARQMIHDRAVPPLSFFQLYKCSSKNRRLAGTAACTWDTTYVIVASSRARYKQCRWFVIYYEDGLKVYSPSQRRMQSSFFFQRNCPVRDLGWLCSLLAFLFFDTELGQCFLRINRTRLKNASSTFIRFFALVWTQEGMRKYKKENKGG